jgi:hypothetical protein
MKTSHSKPLYMLAALGVSALMSAGLAVPALAAPDAGHNMEHDWARHRQERLKARLARTEERLGIQAAQQGAWQAYAAAIENPIGHDRREERIPTDAAGIARRHADMAAAHAARLAKIADATAALQAVLTPEQRQEFDHIVRRDHPDYRDRHHPDGDMARPHGDPAGVPAARAPAYQ